MMVELPDNHRNLCLFRWARKDNKDNWKTVWYRFKRLPWGLKCATAMLQIVLAYVFDQLALKHPEDREACKEMKKSIYMDDVSVFGKTGEECILKMEIAIKALSAACMKLGKFRGYPSEASDQMLKGPSPHQFKILGIMYDADKDVYRPTFDKLPYFLKR